VLITKLAVSGKRPTIPKGNRTRARASFNEPMNPGSLKSNAWSACQRPAAPHHRLPRTLPREPHAVCVIAGGRGTREAAYAMT
jgi:hypothetical protein